MNDSIKKVFGLIILLALVIGTAAFFIMRPVRTRRNIENGFTASDTSAGKSQYRTCSSMEEMNLDAFGVYLSWPRTAEASPDQIVILPCDVHYYTYEGGSRVLSHTQKKGSVITIPGSGLMPGEGYLSYPTFEQGWRYTKRFTENGGEKDDRYYYVKLAELEKVLSDLYDNYPDAAGTMRNAGKKADVIYNTLRLIDRIFYYEGITCSKDLTKYPVTKFGE